MLRSVHADEENIPSSRVAKSWLPTVIKLAITVAILAYLSLKLDWKSVAAQLVQCEGRPLVISCVLLAVCYVMMSLRWQVLLRIQDIDLPAGILIRLNFIGQFFNAFLLGSTGGDLMKILYVSRYTPHRKTAAAVTTLVDRVMGLFAFLTGVMLSLPFVLPAGGQGAHLASALRVSWVVMVLAACAGLLAHRLPGKVGGFLRKGRIGYVTAALDACLTQPLKMAIALAWSFAICLVAAFSFVYLGQGVGVHLTLLEAAALFGTIGFIIAVPVSVGGHGLREGAFVLAFRAYALQGTAEAAVAMSIVFYLLTVVWSLVGGLFYMLPETASPPAPRPAPEAAARLEVS